MNRFLLLSLPIFFISIKAIGDEVNLMEAVDQYSPYSYQANCSYLYDEGCGGSVYDPASNSTQYSGYRPSGGHRYNRNDWKENSQFIKIRTQSNAGFNVLGNNHGGWKHRRDRRFR